MDEEKALAKKNQLGNTNQKQGRQFQCVSIKHLQITSNDCHLGISYQKAKNLALGVGIYLAKTKKASEDAPEEEEANFL